MTEQYLKIYSCCHFVEGARRTMIYDGQRDQYFFVPQSLVDFVRFIERTDYRQAVAALENGQKEVVLGYIDFLLKNEIAFVCNSLAEYDRFADANLQWENAHTFTNAIIEIAIEEDIPEIEEFLKVYIPCIQFILQFEIQSVNHLKSITDAVGKFKCKTISLAFKNYCNATMNDLKNIVEQYPATDELIAFGAQHNETINFNGSIITLSTQVALTKAHCGVVSSKYFNLTVEHFLEGQQYNTCLNRKISIDADGNIKNCPSMKESFGNIRDTTLEEAINKPGFKKYWNIIKDEITKCKDCEFRYVCTDCRAYVEQPEDIYAAPLKCGYDPYTNTWEEWSANPLKQQAIEYYGINSLLPEISLKSLN
jgi:SPASM domain peptide maturase of grasp-with-spasm system